MAAFNERRLLLVGFVANVFEWYDFAVYAYIASIIGVLFFNEHNPQLVLIKSFMVFSVSYLIRPFGSVVFGYISDHYGRSVALKMSLSLMAIPTFLIGLLPTFHTAGFLSVALLMILRLVQGFAAGGELPGSTCYMFEVSPLGKKNFYCSLVAASSMLGVFLGSLTVAVLYIFLSKEFMLVWGWRVPFLIGSIIAFFIYRMRRGITETEIFQITQSTDTPNTHVGNLLQYKYQITQVFLLNAFISVSFYMLFVWMPSYLSVYLNIKPSIAHLTNSISLLALIFFTLGIGYVSRDNNRKKWIASSIFMMMMLSYPLFVLLKIKSIAILLIVQITFAFLLSFIDGVINATMGSLFQPQVRGSGVSIGFTFSTAIFGGLAPTLSSWLAYRTGYVESPVLLIITMAIIAVPAVISLYKYQESFST